MSVELCYHANLKWHMPIREEICERAFRRKSKAQKRTQIDAMLRSGFFFGKHARWRSRVLDFPQDSRIRVNLKINSWRTCVKANLFLHWRIFKNVFKIRSERIHDSHSISIMKNFFRFRLLVQILDSGPSGPSLLDRPWWTVPRIKAKVNLKKLVLSFRNWALMTQPKSTR